MDGDDPNAYLYVLLALSIGVTGLIHISVIPRSFPGDALESSVALIAGWTMYLLSWYLAGRLFSTPETLPNMRGADLGLGLFLVSLLGALVLDSLGFTPDLVLGAYLLPAAGIYAGLSVLGWAFGKRTKTISRLTQQ